MPKFIALYDEDKQIHKLINPNHIRIVDYDTRRVVMGDTLTLRMDQTSFNSLINFLKTEIPA